MKKIPILICVDTDSPANEEAIWKAYRLVEWPVVPRQQEHVYPFILASDVDSTVVVVRHLFERNYLSLILEPFESLQLTALLIPEKEHWIMSTQKDPVSEEDALKRLVQIREAREEYARG